VGAFHGNRLLCKILVKIDEGYTGGGKWVGDLEAETPALGEFYNFSQKYIQLYQIAKHV